MFRKRYERIAEPLAVAGKPRPRLSIVLASTTKRGKYQLPDAASTMFFDPHASKCRCFPTGKWLRR